MKIKSVALFAYISLAQTPPAFAACESLETLNWMLGRWTAESGSDKIIEEWLQVSDNTVEGAGHTVGPNGHYKSSELMRIAYMRENAFYLVDVKHNPLPIVFAATVCSSQEVRFENSQHDFPNALHYMRLNNGYKVSVKDKAGKGFTLTFKE